MAAPARALSFAAPLGFPGEAPATDARLVQLADFANEFWAGQTPETCASISVLEADDLGVDESDRWAGARGGSCAIVFRRDMVIQLNGAAATRDHAIRVTVLADECADVVHEVGHARGLPHLPQGVMMDGVGPAPQQCVAWAARTAGPRHTKRHHRRRSARVRSHKTRHGIVGSSVG
jgi:hypothetical protein